MIDEDKSSMEYGIRIIRGEDIKISQNEGFSKFRPVPMPKEESEKLAGDYIEGLRKLCKACGLDYNPLSCCWMDTRIYFDDESSISIECYSTLPFLEKWGHARD